MPSFARRIVSEWLGSALLLAAYLAIFYPVVIRREQAELQAHYGSAFVEYASRVPVFLPRLSPGVALTERFSWPLYRQIERLNSIVHEFEFLPLFSKYDAVFYDYTPMWKFYLWKIIPLTKYLEYNDHIHIKKMDQKYLDATLGSQLPDTTEKLSQEMFQKIQLKILKSQEPLKELDKKYFIKILDLCIAKKIKIILITTPIYSKNNEYHNNYFSTYLDSVCKALNIKYYGFENLIKSDDIKLFNNNNHMNRMGSIEYSINLGKELRENNE